MNSRQCQRGTRILLLAMGITFGFVSVAEAQFAQQGDKIFGKDAFGLGFAFQGQAVALSDDGNTAVLGGPDDGTTGAAWIFTRASGVWSQQGAKLVGSDGVDSTQGAAVAISGDGRTVIVGGPAQIICADSCCRKNSATWIFAQSNGVWTEQARLVGTGAPSCTSQGASVGISFDGNTAIISGNLGAWIFTRTNSVWTQSAMLTDQSARAVAIPIDAVAISGDGNTAVLGASNDSGGVGAAWVFTRGNDVWTQQGRLTPNDAAGSAGSGYAVAISIDGNTVVLGGPHDYAGGLTGTGAAWVFVRNYGIWTQQGKKLRTSDPFYLSGLGSAASISADGNTAIIGEPGDSDLTGREGAGAAWIFTRTNGTWSQQGAKLVGSGATSDPYQAYQGTAVGMSGDGSTAIVGGYGDRGLRGSAWVFVTPPPARALAVKPTSGSATSQTFTFTFSHANGWQNLSILNVLINGALDARKACYVAFVPPPANSGPVAANVGNVDLVDDAGDAGGPFSAMLLPGNQTVQNSQCSIAGSTSSFSGNGTTLTLTLAITFTSSFMGNKIVYTAARDAFSNSGWQTMGTWSVPGSSISGPSVTSVFPSYSSPFSNDQQTYTFTFYDTNGWQDISVVDVLINNALDASNACYVAFAPINASSGTVYLVNDGADTSGGTPLYSIMGIPGTSLVYNNQCGITSGSIAATGNTLTLTLKVTFYQRFGGTHVIYAAARSNTQNSGWQAVGIVNVADPFAPSILAVDPSSANAGSPGIILTVTGTTFRVGGTCAGACGIQCAHPSIITFDHFDIPTLFLSTTRLQATVPMSLLSTARSADVTVKTPVEIECQQETNNHVSNPVSFGVIP